MRGSKSLIEKYREYLPVSEHTPVISLGEGFTPLVKATRLPILLDCPKLDLYFKLEGPNPTGSFKDRGMTMAISKALEAGSKQVICASTGNTSASAAAYAAKAGIDCFIVLPAGKVALGKLAQAFAYGAKVIVIDGNFDQALSVVRQVSDQFELTAVNSLNPNRVAGQKTAAFEIIETLGDAPDYLFIPVGNAGNISSYWRGFKEWHEIGKANKLPKLCGFEAEGCAAIVKGEPILNPETVASAICIGNPANWKTAVTSTQESQGFIDSVTDAEILDAYRMIAKDEGIFCEPASAASLAGLFKHIKNGTVGFSGTVVCVLTGNGLKDPELAMKTIPTELKPIPADLSSLSKVLKL